MGTSQSKESFEGGVMFHGSYKTGRGCDEYFEKETSSVEYLFPYLVTRDFFGRSSGPNWKVTWDSEFGLFN